MNLQYLIIHCTATPAGREVSSDEIRRWHTSPKSIGGRGWDRVGYAKLFHLDGSISDFIQDNSDDIVDPWEITYGAYGMNNKSRHIAYVGGGNEKIAVDTRTDAQKEMMKAYVLEFVSNHANVIVCGHKDVNATSCPGFDVAIWCRSIGIPEKNIFKK